MKQALKTIVKRIAHWLGTPWRRANESRYYDAEAATLRRVELPNDKLLPIVRSVVAGGERAVIAVKGYSMRPFLEHMRDKVELAPWQELHEGDAILAEISKGQFVLHRIIHLSPDGGITLMGDGNLRGTEHCRYEDVCGLVTKYIRPGGHVTLASDPRLCRRIRLWRRLLPIRRLLLFIYKQTV